MSIQIVETMVVEVKDSKGNELHKGYPIVIRMKGQDVVCRFKEVKDGYFVTETLDGEHENKYRKTSIDKCERISGISPYPPIQEGTMETNPVSAPTT